MEGKGRCQPTLKAHKVKLMVGLVVLLSVVGMSQLLFMMMRMTSGSKACADIDGISMTRDPTNCSIPLLCVGGQALPLTPCPKGQLWSTQVFRCVSGTSPFSDCPHHLHHQGPEIERVNQTSAASQVSKKWSVSPYRMRSVPKGILTGPLLDLIKARFPGHPCTFISTQVVLPHPQACHWFYNCSLSPLDSKWALIEPLSAECPYPKLFSIETRTCLNYKHVNCGERPEFKTPCDYRANSCSQLHCRDCQVRLAGCQGLPDGVHPFPGREWTPWFVTCKDERTVEQKTCDQKTPIFSPSLRECVTSEWVPKQYGGNQALCYGRPDGYHPDEMGRCSRFFHCQDERFVDAYECERGIVFDPDRWTCSPKSRVPPCGNLASSQDLQRYCDGLIDGYHADPYGRCSLYIQCKKGRLLAYLKCQGGTFNPRTKTCETTLNMPAPCGFKPNVCQSRKDGVYPISESKCVLMATCRSGFVSSIDECRNGQVFDYRSNSCQPRDLTPPPCGVAPSCHDKEDGGYPAPHKGCQYFYICLKGHFQGYQRCHVYKGGYSFNPTSAKCDFPHNICPPCGTKLHCPAT